MRDKSRERIQEEINEIVWKGRKSSLDSSERHNWKKDIHGSRDSQTHTQSFSLFLLLAKSESFFLRFVCQSRQTFS